MVTLALARTAAAASTSLIPDLSAKLHPSDSTPWTILLVLTLITLLPAILMAMTPLVKPLTSAGMGEKPPDVPLPNWP